MHLVIRDVATALHQPQPGSMVNAGARDTSPAPVGGAQAQRQQAPSPQLQYQNAAHRQMLAGNRGNREPQRELLQTLLQGQRGRAQLGMRGIGDTNPTQAQRANSADRRGSPAPNPMSPVDLQSIFQNADASQATLTMTNAMNNAMQRSLSSASLQARPLNQPGVTVPVFPGSGSRTGSGRTTPFGGVPSAAPAAPRPGQEVYILSSPDGPRALLVNNATSESYYTPRLSTRRSLPRMYNSAFGQMLPTQTGGMQHQSGLQYQPPQAADLRSFMAQAPQPQYHYPHTSPQPTPQPQGQQPPHVQQQPQGQQRHQPEAQVQPAIQAPMGHGLGHPQGHPPVAAIPPLLRMAWPHLWLIFRLALFVWFFTSPGASWSRWLTIVGMAIFIFVLSTGALNGVAEHIMQPVGRHLDNILPALDAQQGRNGNAALPAANAQQAGGGGNAGPQPAQMADRLLNERRARGGWFTGQFRRVERASLLFLASIAPGVAERHIAHLEAEAARARREAEEATARAAAEAESQNNPDAAEGGEPASGASDSRSPDTETRGQPEQEENQIETQGRQREPEAAPEPLIAL